jgi:hypothetical protein
MLDGRSDGDRLLFRHPASGHSASIGCALDDSLVSTFPASDQQFLQVAERVDGRSRHLSTSEYNVAAAAPLRSERANSQLRRPANGLDEYS